jgi:hypothetical protein
MAALFLSGVPAQLNAPVHGASDSLFLNGFYAINSRSESDVVDNLSSVSVGWARVAKDAQGKIRFATEGQKLGPADEYPEYGIPATVGEEARKLKQSSARKYLSVFCADANPKDELSVPLELLSLSDQQLQEQVINPLVSFLTKNPAGINFQGVVIDFEGLREETPGSWATKNRFNRFLDLLKQRLGERELLVCLTPNNVYNYCDGYDYVHIGQVADTVILMAHDYYHATPGNPRPDIAATAPYYQVEDAVKKMINAGVPREKLLLAIALNGIQWIPKAGGNLEVALPTLSRIEATLAGINGPVVECTPNEHRYLSTYEWGGQTYDYRTGYTKIKRWQDGKLIESEIYYETARSLAEKVDLARSQQLKGISVWRLGLGNQEAWDALITFCASSTGFYDLRNHWSRSEVEYLVSRGIVHGVSARFFNPEGQMTRAEFATIISLALGLKEPAQSIKFKDVQQGDWFYQSVSRAASAGLVSGKTPNQFCPYDRITREEAAVLVMRALHYQGVPVSGNRVLVFADADEIARWAINEVQNATAAGIISGYGQGKDRLFKPKGNITRAEGAVMINRMLGLVEQEI